MKKKIKIRREFWIVLPIIALLLLKMLLPEIGGKGSKAESAGPAPQEQTETRKELPRQQLRDAFRSRPADNEPQEETVTDDEIEDN